jgi:diguanylate cyclase (GGDEF)-like protein
LAGLGVHISVGPIRGGRPGTWRRWSQRVRAPSVSSLDPRSPVWLLTGTLVAVGLLLYLVHVQRLAGLAPPNAVPWWVFIILFGLGEVFVVRIQLHRDTHSFSLSELPLVLGLFFLVPSQLVLAQMLGAGAALIFHRRSPPIKVAFNVGNLAVEACVAATLFHFVLGTANPLGPAGWTAAFAAALTAGLLGLTTISGAIHLSAGRPQGLGRLYATGMLASFFNATLGLAALTIVWEHPEAAWLPAVLAGTLFLAYRAYGSLRQQHDGLEMLYESTHLVQQSLEVERVVETLLAQAQRMFRAERAELLIFPADGESALLSSAERGSPAITRATDLDPREGVWARVAAEGRGVCLTRPILNERLRDHFARDGIRDAMVVPLRGQDVILGTMTVANRVGDGSTFGPEELKLFETLANHASISLQNGRLVDRLRRHAAENAYQAQHDALTGLGNRRYFRERVDEAIQDASARDEPLAVMIMDLDRFKEVNDTLGHRNGDLLLQKISERLVATLDSAVIARLSGDEFAILIRAAGSSKAAAAAQQILRALDEPIDIQELTLQVGGSIGVAMYPEHGRDADTLVQRADVAMYLAKAGDAGYEVYAPERDEYSPARLALVGELRRAIDQGELVLAYQPTADLLTGRIQSAEALVRWQHPTRGMLLPDQFIPMAEHTGLIRPLTLQVLDAAARQCRAWRENGYEMTVAVNMSVRSLLDQGLCARIVHLLNEVGLPTAALELEVTESVIMADPERVEATLLQLSQAGIRIAIDDFGTGYSSLSRLRRLPVSVLKIDRSFVMAMAVDENDAMIVRSTIELGRNLGLRTVAEGVENATTWEQLRRLGCDVAQGFYLSRPVPADQLTVRLAEQAAGAAPGPAMPTSMPVRSANVPISGVGRNRRPVVSRVPARSVRERGALSPRRG